MTDTLLVTGASGKLGQRVVQLLLDRGVAPARIIATTRDTTKLASFAEAGVDVRHADFDAPDSLPAAFAGADRLALISTDAVAVPGQRLAQQTAAVAAAKEAGVAHIFYTSMPKPIPTSPITFAGDHAGTEEAIKASGMTYTILRNSWYQENLAMALPQAFATGQWFSSAGAGRISHVAHEDCAEALAAALLSDEVANATFTLTGPATFDTEEIAAMAAKAAGAPITVVHLSDADLSAGLSAAGLPDFMVPFLVGFDANTRAGLTDFVTDDVERLTGHKPRPLAAYLEAAAPAMAAPAA